MNNLQLLKNVFVTLVLVFSIGMFVGCGDDDNPVNSQIPAVYTTGTVSYDWNTFPIPSMPGSFSITGVSLTETGLFPANITKVCGGSHIPAESGSVAFCYAGELRQDSKVDIFFIIVNNSASSISPGDYTINPLSSFTTFVYLEGVENFVLPNDFNPLDITSWANSLNAENIFLSINGTITVSAVSSSGFSGTFSGSMTTQQVVTYLVTNGSFSVAQ